MHNQEKEIDMLIKTSEKLMKERNDALSQLESTKKYIGSIVTTADLRERSSKEFKMIKELTESLIAKDVEINDLKRQVKEKCNDVTNNYKQFCSLKEELTTLQSSYNLLSALMQHLADMISFPKARNSILEFLSRLKIANDAEEWFHTVTATLASLKVTPL